MYVIRLCIRPQRTNNKLIDLRDTLRFKVSHLVYDIEYPHLPVSVGPKVPHR